jgi:hypothetical protein
MYENVFNFTRKNDRPFYPGARFNWHCRAFKPTHTHTQRLQTQKTLCYSDFSRKHFPFCHRWGSNTGRPARSPSLYQLSCPEYISHIPIQQNFLIWELFNLCCCFINCYFCNEAFSGWSFVWIPRWDPTFGRSCVQRQKAPLVVIHTVSNPTFTHSRGISKLFLRQQAKTLSFHSAETSLFITIQNYSRTPIIRIN